MKKIFIILFVLLLITSCTEARTIEFNYLLNGGAIIATFKGEPQISVNKYSDKRYKEIEEKFLETLYIMDKEFKDKNNSDYTPYEQIVGFINYMDGRIITVDKIPFKITLTENRIIGSSDDGKTIHYITYNNRKNSHSSNRNNRHYSTIGHSIGLGLGGASGSLRGGISGLL